MGLTAAPQAIGQPTLRPAPALRPPINPACWPTLRPLCPAAPSAAAEFFYPALVPYVHYVPVARGLEDLFAAIAWARAHPEECGRIVQQAQAFARAHFNQRFLNRYMLALFVEYAKLLRFAPEPTPEHRRLLVDDALFRAENSSGACVYRP